MESVLNLYGKDQTIAVGDTGLDTGKNDASMHDDLEGRILHLADYGGYLKTLPYDKDGHGTHVAATVLGNGILSGSDPQRRKYDGSYAGAAPEAKLVFQALGDEQGLLWVYPPNPLGEKLFLPAYTYGARVHSNSWGSVGTSFFGVYEGWAQEVDFFTTYHPDMTIVFAAGNHGSQSTTVIPPSTAKNGLSIGGVDTRNPGAVLPWSSRGYTLDGRAKPDLLAPGSYITSARSTQAIHRCTQPANPAYCIYSGTSMATPNVAGLAALTREYFMRYQNIPYPSAALVKATLINGADAVGFPKPSREAGWGRVNISQALPVDQTDLFFADERRGLQTNEQKSYRFWVAKDTPVRVTVVWTDEPATIFPLPGKKLVNDLDVILRSPSGAAFTSNDHSNNVEHLEIQQPEAGWHTVEIKGYNVPIRRQSYALVATYDNALTHVVPQLCQLPNGQSC